MFNGMYTLAHTQIKHTHLRLEPPLPERPPSKLRRRLMS